MPQRGGSIGANSNGTSTSNGIVVGSGSQVSAQGRPELRHNYLRRHPAPGRGRGAKHLDAYCRWSRRGGQRGYSLLQRAIDVNAQAGDLTNGGIISGKTLKLAAAATLSNKVNSKLTADT